MRFLALLFCLSFINLLTAQELMIDTSYTPEEMIMDFFDNDSVSVSNIVYTGNLSGMAFFDSTDDSLGVHAGIVFGTGDVTDLSGAASDFVSSALDASGDVDIDAITGLNSFDASAIEFDFTVSENADLDFSYVFGSEEYPEFVGSAFNDVFAFLISGPNYNGPYTNMAENISLIPGTTDPVAINSVNAMMNQNFFIMNDSSENVSLDGLTTMLPAAFTAIAGEVYHIKIVISDVTDSHFDSAVFLGYNSMGNGDSLVPPATASFTVDGNMLVIENESKYATSYSWDFGNDTYSSQRHPEPVAYATEGTYVVSLITQNYCCSDTLTATIMAGAPIALTANVEQISEISCFEANDAQLAVALSGGQAPYDVLWTPEISDLNMVAAGNYMYVITDAIGSQITGEILVEEPDELIAEIAAMDSEAGLDNGSASVVASGGTGDYTYLWNNGGITAEITDLPAGIYECIVTDENDCSVTKTVEVASVVNTFEEKVMDLKVYPSPANEIVFIDLPPNNFIQELIVFDFTGKRIYLQTELIAGTAQLNVESLKNGIYYISITTDDNNSPLFGRFMKN